MEESPIYQFHPFFISTPTLERLAWLQYANAGGQPELREGFIAIYHARNTATDFYDPQWLKSQGIELEPKIKVSGIVVAEPTRSRLNRRFHRHRWIYVPTKVCSRCTFRTSRATRLITCSRINNEYWEVDVKTRYSESLPSALVQIWHQILPRIPSS